MKKISFLAFACVLGATFYSAHAATLVSGGSGTSGAMVARAGSLRVNANTQPTSAPSATSGAESTRIAITGYKPKTIGNNVVTANNTNNTNYGQLQVAIRNVEDSLNALKNVLTTTEAMANEALKQSNEAVANADVAVKQSNEAVLVAGGASDDARNALTEAGLAKEFANNSPAVEALKRANDQAEEISGLKVSLTEQLNELKNQKAAFEQEVAANNVLREQLNEKFKEVSDNLVNLDAKNAELAKVLDEKPNAKIIEEKIAMIEAQANEAKNSLNELDKKVASIDSVVGNGIDNIGAELGNKASKESVDKLVEEMYSLRADIGKAQNTADSAQKTADSAQQIADSAKENNDKISGQLVSLSDTWDQRRKEDNDKFQNEINKTNDNASALTSRVKKNEEDIDKTGKDFSDFKDGEAGRISAAVKDSVEDGIKNSATIGDLSQKIGKVELDADSLKNWQSETGAGLVNKMNTLETNVANNTKSIQTNAANITANNSQFQDFFTGAGANSLSHILNTQNDLYNGKIDTAKQELNASIATVADSVSDLDTKYENLKTSVVGLNHELVTAGVVTEEMNLEVGK